ncbi:MAG TPA: OmpA family protein [Candidatus Aminicenantes bacterium]|nr:OmpA family protein [Candidatus Aminicenantes bacterium]HRY65674.1 OmpA family protein [Candidatus Aminicenantes bacterium]HRZ72438.1 OmpA family protein [Candidatus Aminicenantes bacterium]
MFKRRIVVLAAALLAASSALTAAEIQLTALTLQSGKTFELGFSKTNRAPSGASVKAAVGFDNGQASVKLTYKKMEPAILFAGDIAAYVLWAVVPDGTVENLGEVIADKKSASGSVQAYTGKKTFALMVTAEPFATVTRPTELVLFLSGQVQGVGAVNTPFAFRDFSAEYRPAIPSIASIQYNDPTPAAVNQAQKALEIAGRLKAAEINPKAMDGAQIAFGKAMASKDKKVMADQARVAVQLASQAIKETIKAAEAKAAAEAEAKRLAERAALEERAATAENEADRIARELREVKAQREALASESAGLAKQTEALAAQRDSLTAERDALARDRDAIKKERDELAGLLKGALSSVAETTESARGVIVSLSGILFDVGKATLKPASQLTVAKLAGILMVFPRMDLSIEGYTDSTGSAELNMKLSVDRARAVYDFLLTQGISSNRMKFQGFGPESPVAPNDTEANRARNRRVEVVLTQAAR